MTNFVRYIVMTQQKTEQVNKGDKLCVAEVINTQDSDVNKQLQLEISEVKGALNKFLWLHQQNSSF